jgi:hypothetical protein
VFAHYWRDVHGPLCSRLPGLGWYVQHHFDRKQDAHLWPSEPGLEPVPGYVLDGMVESASRTAALIAQLGAMSQLSPEVDRLIRTGRPA